MAAMSLGLLCSLLLHVLHEPGLYDSVKNFWRPKSRAPLAQNGAQNALLKFGVWLYKLTIRLVYHASVFPRQST